LQTSSPVGQEVQGQAAWPTFVPSSTIGRVGGKPVSVLEKPGKRQGYLSMLIPFAAWWE
jgi:hypothetical protein